MIEAGPNDNTPVIQVPLGYGMTFYNKKMNWNFYSENQKNLYNREIYYPRGKVLGGSGSINAMIYARGLRSDFENWDLSENWSWESIKTSYEQLEFEVNENTIVDTFASKLVDNNTNALVVNNSKKPVGIIQKDKIINVLMNRD